MRNFWFLGEIATFCCYSFIAFGIAALMKDYSRHLSEIHSEMFVCLFVCGLLCDRIVL